MRFTDAKQNPNGVNGSMHVANKAKCDSDSVQLGGLNARIQENTTTGDQYKCKDIQARKINTPLHPFVANNIRTTHYVIGPGGQSRPTETKDQFQSDARAKESKF